MLSKALLAACAAAFTLGLPQLAQARPADQCPADYCSPPPSPSHCSPSAPDSCDEPPQAPRCQRGALSDLCGPSDKASPHYCVGPARRDCSPPPDPRLR